MRIFKNKAQGVSNKGVKTPKTLQKTNLAGFDPENSNFGVLVLSNRSLEILLQGLECVYIRLCALFGQLRFGLFNFECRQSFLVCVGRVFILSDSGHTRRQGLVSEHISLECDECFSHIARGEAHICRKCVRAICTHLQKDGTDLL